MTTRRDFLGGAVATAGAASLAQAAQPGGAMIVSTWDFGAAANDAAFADVAAPGLKLRLDQNDGFGEGWRGGEDRLQQQRVDVGLGRVDAFLLVEMLGGGAGGGGREGERV